MTNKKIVVNIWAFSILGLILAATVYFNYFRSDGGSQNNPEEPTEETSLPNVVVLSEDQISKMNLDIRTAGPGELEMIISTRGKIIPHPDGIVHILPNVPGVAYEAKKKIGDKVTKGDVLAVLESQEMANLKANYLAAINKEKLAASILDRERSLYQKQISPEQDFLNAQSSFEETRINAQLAQQKLYAIGLSEKEIHKISLESDDALRFYTIYSPIDGVVTHRHLTKGEYVESDATIYELADFGIVWVEMGIYPQDFSRIKPGQQVTVTLPIDNKSARASIIYLKPVVEGETITALAVAELENPYREWFPGSFVKVEITTDKIPVPLVVNRDAIQSVNGENCVFLCNEKGFEMKPILQGRTDKGQIEVVEGLSEGDRYANHPFLLKADQAKNTVEDDD